MLPRQLSPAGSGRTADSEPDSYLLLSTEQARQIDQFYQDIHHCGTDAEKYELCIRMRNLLLEEHSGLELLIATIEGVMCRECPEYKKRKEKARPRRSDEADAEEWDRFIGVAAAGSALVSKCLEPLKEVSRVWGRDMVQHYQLATKGENYCKRARATARRIPDFRGEAVPKLNRVMLRRHHMPGRRPIAASVNPLAPTDLENVRDWLHKDPFIKKNDPEQAPLPFAPLTVDELPPGYGFDKYGLMVQEEFAVSLSESEAATAVESSGSAAEESSRPYLVLGGLDDADRAEAAGLTANPPPSVAFSLASIHFSAGDAPACEKPDNVSSSSSNTSQKAASGPAETDGLARNLRTRKQVDAASHTYTGCSTRDLRKPKQVISYREAAGGTARPKPARPLAIITTVRRCCPEEVPDELLSLLDGQSASSDALLQNRSYQNQLCRHHLELFAKQIAAIVFQKITAAWTAARENQVTPGLPEPIRISRRRSLSDNIDNPSAKRYRPDGARLSTATQGGSHACLERDTRRNEACRSQIISELSQKITKNRSTRGSRGERVDRLMLEILNKAEQANLDESKGPIEAYFLDGEEAATVVESASDNLPIFTYSQQPFQWTDKERPIAQFFQRIGDLHRSVSVQVPSRPRGKDSFETHTVREVRERFLKRELTDDPWNILDLCSPLPPSVLPSFLTGPNCQLLLSIRDAILMANSAERITASGAEWRMWRHDQEMALLSEGGHNTAPHTDSSSKATWLTVQEGLYLFVWMSNPTPEEWNAWVADPDHFTGGRWRYEVLGPGQTVFFRSGAIHGISRPRDQQTLVLAGHVLLWSDIVRWMEVFIVQMRNPHITNEDMESSAYLVKVVKRLVSNLVRDCRVERLGGQEAVTRFFALVKEFEKDQMELEMSKNPGKDQEGGNIRAELERKEEELRKKLKELAEKEKALEMKQRELERKQKEFEKRQEEFAKNPKGPEQKRSYRKSRN